MVNIAFISSYFYLIKILYCKKKKLTAVVPVPRGEVAAEMMLKRAPLMDMPANPRVPEVVDALPMLYMEIQICMCIYVYIYIHIKYIDKYAYVYT
jgi:hypothetical protein